MTAATRQSFLQLLPPATQAALLEGCEAVIFAEGAAVVRAGDPGDAYYIVEEGVAEVVSPSGEPLARLGPGEGFGELALLLDRPRTASVIALGPLRCLRLSAEHFRRMARDPEWLLRVVSALAARQADDNARLERALHRLERTLAELKHSYEQTVTALAAAVEARDPYTGGHVERCGPISRALAAELGLSPEEQELAGLSGALHDIGKVAVPDAVLLKAGPLNPVEEVQMRRHSAAGAAILMRIEHLANLAPVVRAHHERWDGEGYPDGLAGEAIPLGACIVAVADTFDAITTTRPYHPSQPRRQAVEEIAARSGSQFAPQVVEAFLNLVHRGALPI